MSRYLARVARWSFEHRWRVTAAWLAVAFLAVVVATLSGGRTVDTFTIPGTESQQVSDLLARDVPQLSGGQMQVVLAAPAGQTLDPHESVINGAVKELRDVDGVTEVQNPFTAGLVARDGSVALMIVRFSDQPVDVSTQALDAVRHALAPLRSEGLTVAYAGSVYPGWHTKLSEVPELVGLAIALAILVVTFGSILAALLPILSAILGVGITLMGVTAVAATVNVASASTTVALMLGLSCGIDYGLFLVSRYRTYLIGGLEATTAIALAAGTAGGSVVFAGLTVIVALCGMSVVGVPFLTVMGLCAAGAVLVALLIALTLVPAILGLVGARVLGRRDRLGTERPAAREPFGVRWARLVVRRRVPVLLIGVVLLGVIALPVTDIELGLPSGASQPTSNTQRQAYDLTTRAFGPGFNGALLVTAQPVTSKDQTAEIVSGLQQLPGVATVTPILDEKTTVVVQVIPTTGPSDDATAQLVHRIRDQRERIAGDTGAVLLVGGQTASNIDVSAKLSSALPVFLLVVTLLALVLLTFAFRTVLVPIKSVLGFLLSVAAAFGAEVAMFQWGWGEHLLGVTRTQTISFLPIIMLAIIFGLSSDYEVFVVSRIKEEFTATGDARAAVVRGTAQSARVVTAAALIMFSIFVAFMLTRDPTIRAIGFSFAVGVFLDAFVVRLTLVPAVMALAGAAIWHHPRWFARYVPDPDIEGERLQRDLAASGR